MKKNLTQSNAAVLALAVLIFPLTACSAQESAKKEEALAAAPTETSREKPKEKPKEEPKEEPKTGGKKSAAELEREKALQNPYPNDLGPGELDKETLASYPKNIQEGYKALLGDGKTKKNCQSCHTASRPLNSRFVELSGKTDAEREAKVKKLKESNPELFKDIAIWQIEAKVWNRYVKRMMAKPGCGVSNADGKKIWEFLVYDSEQRKIGKNSQKWKAHRQRLLTEFKAKHPKRYEDLEKEKSL